MIASEPQQRPTPHASLPDSNIESFLDELVGWRDFCMPVVYCNFPSLESRCCSYALRVLINFLHPRDA